MRHLVIGQQRFGGGSGTACIWLVVVEVVHSAHWLLLVAGLFMTV